MTLLTTSMVLSLAVSAGEIAPSIVQAPDSPVRVSRAKIFNVVAEEPAVLFYAATNLTDDDLEEFTIVAYIFDAQGTLKARQTLVDARSAQHEILTMVLDGWAVTTADRVVFGVNQALRVGSGKVVARRARETARKS
jgi:hypothetical protein